MYQDNLLSQKSADAAQSPSEDRWTDGESSHMELVLSVRFTPLCSWFWVLLLEF